MFLDLSIFFLVWIILLCKFYLGYLDEVHAFYGKQSFLLRLLSSPGGMSIREGTFIFFLDFVQGVLLLRRVRLFGTIE